MSCNSKFAKVWYAPTLAFKVPRSVFTVPKLALTSPVLVIYNAPPIPTPPATTSAPDPVDDDTVALARYRLPNFTLPGVPVILLSVSVDV